MQKTAFDLQKEYYEAEFIYKELQAKYDLCKTSFENLLRGNFDDVIGTREFQKALLSYLKDVEAKTKAYCSILELTEIKEQLEENVSKLCKSELEPSSSEIFQCSIYESPPGYEEYSKMRLDVISLKLKWLRYNLTKYEFALEHFEEFQQLMGNKTKSTEKLKNDIKHYNQSEKSMTKRIERLRNALQGYKSGKKKWLRRLIHEASKECRVMFPGKSEK